MPLRSDQLRQLLAFLHAFGTVGPSVFGQESVKLTHAMYENLNDTVGVVKVIFVPNKDKKCDAEGRVYDDQYKIRWNSDAYPVDHAKVSSVPKNPDFANYPATAPDDDVYGL